MHVVWLPRWHKRRRTLHWLLSEKSQPLQSVQYREGPRAREIEKMKIEKMIKAGGIKPAKTGLAALILLALKIARSLFD